MRVSKPCVIDGVAPIQADENRLNDLLPPCPIQFEHLANEVSYGIDVHSL